MSAFIPLNVYPDSDSEGDAENTQEIQIEEALKLYQRALKLHTDKDWEEAHKAYDELFSSEIFQADTGERDGDDEQVHGRGTTTASSLPLVLYLAYKNHGAFKLDRLHATGTTADLSSTIHQALDWFSTALGRDAGDPSLWRKSAQLALAIDSSRLARFALESILDTDSDSVIPSPEEHLATLKLRDVMRKICDSAALENPRFKALEGKKLQARFGKFLNPYPWLPLPETSKIQQETLDEISTRKQVVAIPQRTWSAAGRALLPYLSAPPEGQNTSTALQLTLPTVEGEPSPSPLSRSTTPETPTPAKPSPTSEDITMPSPPQAQAPTARRRSGSAARKRKSASLGATEGDAGRSRLSKRQREKKEADALALAAASAPAEHKQPRAVSTDEKLFATADTCFSPLNIHLGAPTTLRIPPPPPPTTTTTTTPPSTLIERDDLYLTDFRTVLRDWDDDKGNVVLYGDGIQSPDETAQGMAFLEMETNVPSRPLLSGDEGLRKWVRVVNTRACTPKEAAVEWLMALCVRDVHHRPGGRKPTVRGTLGAGGQASWVRHSWPEALRVVVTEVARECEDVLWRYFKTFEAELGARVRERADAFGEAEYAVVEWAQTMLEVFLGELSDLSREGDNVVVEARREAVKRWLALLGDLTSCRPRDAEGQLAEDALTLRYLWSVAASTAFTDAHRDFRLSCFTSLQETLSLTPHPPFELPNSTLMPEISALRATREISKLKTVDFFTTIFTLTTSSTTATSEIIDILEAVLSPDSVEPYDEEERLVLQEITRFLDGSSAMFRLHLWERLKAAYERVGYRAKVLVCILKCIEVVMGDLKERSYVESSPDHRYFVLLRALRLVEEMLPVTLSLVSGGMGNVNMSELDNRGLVDGMRALGALLRLLHTYAFWEDAVQASEAVQSDLHSYRLVVVKFREMMVRAWCVVYLLYREAVERGLGAPGGGAWEEGEREKRLCRLLKDVHDELGVRYYCKLGNHVFLKLMHDELLRYNLRDFDSDLLQCIHCRFHLMICSDQWHFHEHKTDSESLDKATAMQLMPFLLHLASEKKILQLAKTDIKSALDRLFDVVGSPRANGNIKLAHNENVIDLYLRGSVHPLRLYGALKGEIWLSTVEVGGLYAQVAAKGLYFLLGKCALYPVRYQKKVGAVKGEELETAVRFFRADLHCMPEKWETWYRLAQAYESQMEEAQTWSADGINSRRLELVGLERRAILCFMMSTALAIRHADTENEEIREELSEMFMDFGYRVYSAARPPMAMESFWVEGFDRHYSGRNGEGMYKARAHPELTLLNALKLAMTLFKTAVDLDDEENWKAHYMIGKCMGKLLDQKETRDLYTPEEVLEKYVTAISYCPEKIGSDHIFEPHHKLVSTASKYVLRDLMTPAHACKILEATPFSKKVEPAEEREDFVRYILEVLKKMRTADKPKWHHRMTNRAAQLKFEEQGDTAGARAEFSTLFSNKAAQLSIWRPENERPGRHFVFASAYTMFYVNLLEQLDDRATLEVLAKRVRRLANGLFRHADVWQHVLIAYIKVLRHSGGIADQADEGVFGNVSYDEFNTNSQRLELYCNLKDTTTASSPTLELLREVYELRRLNAGLAKTPLVDDLLADTYAQLYAELVPEILKQLSTTTTTTTTTAAATPQQQLENESRANPMSLKNLMIFNEDPIPPAAAEVAKIDDLPIRMKMTKVTRRELVSRAAGICKVATAPVQGKQAATAGGSSASSVVANPSSPKRTLLGDGRMGSPEDTPMGSPQRDGDSDEGMESDGDGDISAMQGDE